MKPVSLTHVTNKLCQTFVSPVQQDSDISSLDCQKK